MPGDPGVIWCGSQGPLPPPQVLGESPDGGKVSRVLQRTLPWGERCDGGVPAVSHHLQCGGGHSGPPMGIYHGIKVCQGRQQGQRSGTVGATDTQGAQRRATEDGGQSNV